MCRIIPWHKKASIEDNDPRPERAEESIREAERVTRIQVILTDLALRGKNEEFIRVATGAYPADAAADRLVRR